MARALQSGATMSSKGKSLAEVEKELARRVLFRADPFDRSHCMPLEKFASTIQASLSTVREAVQRFSALGLVHAVPSKGLIMERQHLVESPELIRLRLGAATQPEHRLRALRDYVEALSFVMKAGIVASLDSSAPNVARMNGELRELEVTFALGANKKQIASKLNHVILHAGMLSDEIALNWVAVGLYRAFEAVAPWVTAAIAGREDHPPWREVADLYGNADRALLSPTIERAIAPICRRIIERSRDPNPIAGRLPGETDPPW